MGLMQNMRMGLSINEALERTRLHTGAEAIVIGGLISAGSAVYAAKNQPKIPTAPKQPEMQTGQVAETQSTKTLEEDGTKKVSARKTARKGAAAYRIPLESKSAGASISGGSGLTI